MKVILAGFNIDTEVMAKLGAKKRPELTPETIAAAYARISRSPLPVDELRRASRQEVDRARKSNRTIIFEMGHHSVAEHAVFNFDIIGVSRLAVEEIEKFRLNSYTEKSQRYVTVQGDYIVPDEIKNTAQAKEYESVMGMQAQTYAYFCRRLRGALSSRRTGKKADAAVARQLENQVKEDARYVLPLATQTQLGLTVNGRNLELMLRRFAAHPLSEVRQLGAQLFAAVGRIAPSIILFYQSNEFDERRGKDLARNVGAWDRPESGRSGEAVQLVSYTPGGDEAVLAALTRSVTRRSYEECLSRVVKMTRVDKQQLFKAALERMQLYDAVPREFEYAVLTFELIVSASCFAQLKRHRTLTMTSQAYEPALGVTVPEIIRRQGLESRFDDVISRSEHLYDQIRGQGEETAAYVLTNSHRKRVLVSLNLRELYHISRLRQDQAAQWDIRNLVGTMVRKAEQVMPLACFLIGGKDQYAEIYKKAFGKPPRVIKAELPKVKKF